MIPANDGEEPSFEPVTNVASGRQDILRFLGELVVRFEPHRYAVRSAAPPQGQISGPFWSAARRQQGFSGRYASGSAKARRRRQDFAANQPPNGQNKPKVTRARLSLARERRCDANTACSH
jgi:hypothetical protein